MIDKLKDTLYIEIQDITSTIVQFTFVEIPEEDKEKIERYKDRELAKISAYRNVLNLIKEYETLASESNKTQLVLQGMG